MGISQQHKLNQAGRQFGLKTTDVFTLKILLELQQSTSSFFPQRGYGPVCRLANHRTIVIRRLLSSSNSGSKSSVGSSASALAGIGSAPATSSTVGSARVGSGLPDSEVGEAPFPRVKRNAMDASAPHSAKSGAVSSPTERRASLILATTDSLAPSCSTKPLQQGFERPTPQSSIPAEALYDFENLRRDDLRHGASSQTALAMVSLPSCRAPRNRRHQLLELGSSAWCRSSSRGRWSHTRSYSKLGHLVTEVLGVGRDASIAVKSCPHSASEICIRKVQSLQWSEFDADIIHTHRRIAHTGVR